MSQYLPSPPLPDQKSSGGCVGSPANGHDPPPKSDDPRDSHCQSGGQQTEQLEQQDDMTERVAQTSRPDVQGGDVVRLSDEAINEIYYDVVGGSKKNDLYGLGSHARVAYDHVMALRVRCRFSSQSNEVRELRLENQALKDRVTALEQSERSVDERVRMAVEQSERLVDEQVRMAVEQSEQSIDERIRMSVDHQMREFFDRFSVISPSAFPTPHHFDSQETEDPNAPDK